MLIAHAAPPFAAGGLGLARLGLPFRNGDVGLLPLDGLAQIPNDLAVVLRPVGVDEDGDEVHRDLPLPVVVDLGQPVADRVLELCHLLVGGRLVLGLWAGLCQWQERVMNRF